MRRSLLGSFIVFIVLACTARAGDVAVLVDVSGSMAHYGPWQQDATHLIRNILEKGSVADDKQKWSATGNEELIKEFKLVSGDHIQLIRFGSIHPGLSSFFPVDNLTTIEALESQFPKPGDFKDGRTNKDLATAVAITIVGGPQHPARIIAISDFLSDADLNKEQQGFVNGVMQGTSLKNAVIFSWKQRPQVMVRLQEITVAAQQTPLTNNVEKGNIQLVAARFNADPRTLLMSWRAQGPAPVSYDIRVVPSDGSPPFAKTGLISTEFLIADPPGGELTWSVTAHYAGGGSTSASRHEDLPDGGNTGLVVIAAIVIALLIAGFWYMRRHGASVAATVKRTFGRSDNADL
jgi:hypothetical protein